MLGRAGGEEGITTVGIVAGKELSEKLIWGLSSGRSEEVSMWHRLNIFVSGS